MFDLESAIENWKHDFHQDGLVSPENADELEAHTHSITPPAATDDAGSGLTTTGTGGAETITPYNSASTDGTETRPRNIALMFIIKF